MNKEFPISRSSALLFCVGDQRKSITRPMSDSDSDSKLDREIQEIMDHESSSSDSTIKDCSPKRLSFDQSLEEPDPSVIQSCSHAINLSSDTSIREEASTIMKCVRKKRKRITARPSAMGPVECYSDSGQAPLENEIVNIGERKFKRIRILTPKKFTPGVRRSKRKTVQPLVPGELIEYKHHWGSTPQQRLGREVKNIFKPLSPEKKPPKLKLPKEKENDDHFLKTVDLDTGECIEKRIVQPLSSIIPTNVRGETLLPGDDVSYQKFISEHNTSCGFMSFRRHSNKSPVRTGDNCFVFYVIKGSIIVNINDQEFNIKSKTWFTVPPNTVYSVTNDNKSVADIIYIINKL